MSFANVVLAAQAREKILLDTAVEESGQDDCGAAALHVGTAGEGAPLLLTTASSVSQQLQQLGDELTTQRVLQVAVLN